METTATCSSFHSLLLISWPRSRIWRRRYGVKLFLKGQDHCIVKCFVEVWHAAVWRPDRASSVAAYFNICEWCIFCCSLQQKVQYWECPFERGYPVPDTMTKVHGGMGCMFLYDFSKVRSSFGSLWLTDHNRSRERGLWGGLWSTWLMRHWRLSPPKKTGNRAFDLCALS